MLSVLSPSYRDVVITTIESKIAMAETEGYDRGYQAGREIQPQDLETHVMLGEQRGYEFGYKKGLERGKIDGWVERGEEDRTPGTP